MNDLESLVSEILGVPITEIDMECELQDLPRWSSLVHVQLVVGIQSILNAELERDEIESLKKLSDAKSLIERRLEARPVA